MDKKGTTMLTILIAIIFFMFGILIMNLIKPVVTTARDSENLDCSNSTISHGNKFTCLIVDGTIPYFIIILVSTAGGAIINKFVE